MNDDASAGACTRYGHFALPEDSSDIVAGVRQHGQAHGFSLDPSQSAALAVLQGVYEDLIALEGLGTRKLAIRTYKYNGKMTTLASVSEYEVSNGFAVTKHLFAGHGGDFSRTMIRRPGVRCTEKNILAQHAEVVAVLPAILAEVMAHYEKYPPEKEAA